MVCEAASAAATANDDGGEFSSTHCDYLLSHSGTVHFALSRFRLSRWLRMYFHLDINVRGTKNTKLMCFCGCNLKPNCSVWKCNLPQGHIYITRNGKPKPFQAGWRTHDSQETEENRTENRTERRKNAYTPFEPSPRTYSQRRNWIICHN